MMHLHYGGVRPGPVLQHRFGSLVFQAIKGYNLNVKRSRKKVIPKKRGRPATGKDPLVALRLPAEMISAIDNAAKLEGISRSEKIRQLIGSAL